jgi:hypothetical protein
MPSTEKRVKFLEKIPTVVFKTAAKIQKVSVNVFVMSVLSMSLKQYFLLKGDIKTTSITFGSSYGYKDILPTSIETLEMNNAWTPITYDFPLRLNF